MLAAVQFQFAVRAEISQLLGAHHQFDHPRVEVFDKNAIIFVIFRQQPDRVGLDAQIDVFAHEHGLAFWL